MQVKEIMSQDVRCVPSSATLVDAAVEMSKSDIGFLAIVDDKIIGVVTDRDIVVRGIAEGHDPNQATVKQVMTGDLFVLTDDQSIENAATAMQTKRVRRLLVQDSNGKCAGVVSLGDLAAAGHLRELSGTTLEEVCSH